MKNIVEVIFTVLLLLMLGMGALLGVFAIFNAGFYLIFDVSILESVLGGDTFLRVYFGIIIVLLSIVLPMGFIKDIVWSD